MSLAISEVRQLPPATEPAAPPVVAGTEQPTEEEAGATYWGDRLGLYFWLGGAGLLVLMHVGQQVVYFLR
jgi:hypothetical protein